MKVYFSINSINLNFFKIIVSNSDVQITIVLLEAHSF